MSGLSVGFVATSTVSLLVFPFVQNEGVSSRSSDLGHSQL